MEADVGSWAVERVACRAASDLNQVQEESDSKLYV